MSEFRWLVSVVGWDGLLPVAVGLAPLLVKGAFPAGHIAEVMVAMFVPIAAALVRTSYARKQLIRTGDGTAPWGRQIALAAAVVLLLFFEIGVSIAAFAGDRPNAWFCFPAALYFVYLVLIGWALRQLPTPLLSLQLGQRPISCPITAPARHLPSN